MDAVYLNEAVQRKKKKAIKRKWYEVLVHAG
jgi:hypothetical protein